MELQIFLILYLWRNMTNVTNVSLLVFFAAGCQDLKNIWNPYRGLEVLNPNLYYFEVNILLMYHLSA